MPNYSSVVLQYLVVACLHASNALMNSTIRQLVPLASSLQENGHPPSHFLHPFSPISLPRLLSLLFCSPSQALPVVNWVGSNFQPSAYQFLAAPLNPSCTPRLSYHTNPPHTTMSRHYFDMDLQSANSASSSLHPDAYSGGAAW